MTTELRRVVAEVQKDTCTRRAFGAIGDLVARTDVLRLLSRRVAEALDAGETPTGLAALVKLFGTQVEQDTVDVARAHFDVEPSPDGHDELATMLAQATYAATPRRSERDPGRHRDQGAGAMTLVDSTLTSATVNPILAACPAALTPAAAWKLLVDHGFHQVGVPEEGGTAQRP